MRLESWGNPQAVRKALPPRYVMTTISSRVADYSIILGGRAGVGKSSLYHRLIKGSFPEEPRSTSGHYEDGLERGVYRTHVNGDEVKVYTCT